VLCDLATLASLPMREYRAGLAEVIKYGIIYDAGCSGVWSVTCRNSCAGTRVRWPPS
jgi:3-dehydroquinate synthetase